MNKSHWRASFERAAAFLFRASVDALGLSAASDSEVQSSTRPPVLPQSFWLSKHNGAEDQVGLMALLLVNIGDSRRSQLSRSPIVKVLLKVLLALRTMGCHSDRSGNAVSGFQARNGKLRLSFSVFNSRK